MKKLLFAAMAIVAFASCTKENNDICQSKDDARVNVSFSTDGTRSFFQTTAAAEAWEKSLSSVTMFVFNNSGNLIVQRSFSATEVTAKSASFALPTVSAGSSCDFYAVANLPVTGITTKASLLAVIESSAAGYNGTFDEVSAAAKRAGGFVMSGTTTQSLAAEGSVTNVTVSLKRTVAKVAIEVTKSATFGTQYPGSVRVNNITVKKAASQSPVIKPATANPGTMNFSFTQNSNMTSDRYQNLFYLFENGNLAAGSRIMLTMDATYDSDGNFATVADQTPVSYDVELTGDAAGAITRNAYYRVAISIDGLSGNVGNMTVTVADWETPVTQDVSVGV